MIIEFPSNAPRNQCRVTSNELAWIALNYPMALVAATESVRVYEYTNHINDTHTIVIPTSHHTDLSTIASGQLDLSAEQVATES